MSEKILRLTRIWYEYVSFGHHKDRDCHFEITKQVSYGDEISYYVTHNGYIANDYVSDSFDTYEEAENDLYRFLKEIIREEQAWAEGVIENHGEYDEDQLESARFILKVRV